jgi:DNA helicase MCM8
VCHKSATATTQEFEGAQFKHLVHALCPAIYGHELVKAGMLLAMFGGVRKNVGDCNSVPTRGDIHVLIVGDPGLGKSQLLQVGASPVCLQVTSSVTYRLITHQAIGTPITLITHQAIGTIVKSLTG